MLNSHTARISAFRAVAFVIACAFAIHEFSPSCQPLVPLLAKPDGKYGAIFEMSFLTTDGTDSIEFVVFANGDGALAGIDVHANSNSSAIPEGVHFQEQSYHVHVSQPIIAWTIIPADCMWRSLKSDIEHLSP